MYKDICTFFSLTAISLLSVYVVKKYLLDDKKKWIKIGTLKQIFIYPLDGGPGQERREATCRKFGFTSGDMIDRSLIIFPEESRSAILHLETPELALQNIEGILNEYKFYSVNNNFIPYRRRVINYLGDPIFIHQFLNHTCIRYYLGHLAAGLNIGFFPPEMRKEFMNRIKSKTEIRVNDTVDVFSSNYSSYTLINTKSLSKLMSYAGMNDILPNQFRPHFVIEGKYPFCEDTVKSLKIGKVEFDNIIPCTHTDFVNYRQFENEEEPYAALQEFRPLRDVYGYPDLSKSQAPVFGINMELIPAKEGKITVGDAILAKF